jgi:hypothetical protein
MSLTNLLDQLGLRFLSDSERTNEEVYVGEDAFIAKPFSSTALVE